MSASNETEINLLSFAATETLINTLYEHLCRPRWIPVESRIVLLGVTRFDSLDLRQRHSFFERILNAVANDGHHVPVLEHVMFVADSAMAGDRHCPAFLQVLRNHQVEQPVQAFDHSVD